jgi:aspartyl-tRNA(Asn)/glutamyl-tRNA(Gln) amidotransferase subunit B
MTAAIAYELDRQTALLDEGKKVAQETLGWDEENQVTVSQRSKEEAHDYRYFPEPDLPPLVISRTQIDAAQAALPERPDRRFRRFVSDLGLDTYQADHLTNDRATADFYEAALGKMAHPDAILAANWLLGELFGLMNERGETIDSLPISPEALAVLLGEVQAGTINNATAKTVLTEMVATGKNPTDIIRDSGMQQISDREALAQVVKGILAEYPNEVQAYRDGKTTLKQWFFGQVMRRTKGQANPGIVQILLDELL